jgi:hypothetical protein
MLRSFSLARSFALASLLVPLSQTVGCSDGGSDGSGGSDGDGGSGSSGTASGDTTPPTVIASFPSDGSTDESITTEIRATFSEAMAPASVSDVSFVVEQGGSVVPGALTYFDATASFAPAQDLALGATYTVTITTAATDAAGNALEAEHVWSFTTDATAPIGPAPVSLGAAGDYVILAKAAISNVPTSVITGDVGLSPAAATYVTGFGLTKAGTRWTSPQITGAVFAADNDPPTPSNLTTAVASMLTAYTDAAGRPTPTASNLGGGTIGGLTFTPGLYQWSSSVTIPTNITISGAPNDVWIFQVTGDLKLSAAQAMTLSGGARAKNIVWQVAGSVDLGTTSHAEGVILSKTAINLGTGSSVNGRLFAQTAVNLAGATVTVPAP